MARKSLVILLVLFYLPPCSLLFAQDWVTPFEKKENYSASYEEVIDYYQRLAEAYPGRLQLMENGPTDIGLPLHTLILSVDGIFDPDILKRQEKLIVFVNNAIHPGEPCGVDASMMLVRDLLQQPDRRGLLDRIVLVIVPMYNLGGALNRSGFSRANQEGPEAYGFRGNARNLDLNRDFIKCDSKNAQTFNQVYNYWDPDIFIDNHTSNGADYQYSITLIATQHNKLDPGLAAFMQNELLPPLYEAMAEDEWEMTPYVYARGTPENGIAGFLDLPRYSSGYAALHHAISFMPETHMLKPFRNRVWSVYHFMDNLLDLAYDNRQRIRSLRAQAYRAVTAQDSFDLQWTLDQSQVDSITFKGYRAAYKPSRIHGEDRLYYDHQQAWTATIPYYNYYQSTLRVRAPKAYLLPQAYSAVIDRLRWNGVQLQTLEKDTTLEVEAYYITAHDSPESPYEGHFLHRNVQVETRTQEWSYRAGDYLVSLDQPAKRYIIETLEPQGPDSFFAWNFFDGILQQKEYFSSYVFEDTAWEYLQNNPDLQKAFQSRKAEDPEFADSPRAQLEFIYKNSPYFEPTVNRYPVTRLVGEH